jgi:hypothetical protein
VPNAAPSIEVTSAPDTARDTPPTDPVPGLHASGVVTQAPITVRADEVAEPNAATVVASAPVEVPALTERQFSTTQKSPPSTPVPSSDGTGLVIGVAAAALFVGLLAGVMLLRTQRDSETDQHRALPAPLPVSPRQPSEPRVKAKAPPPPAPSAEKPLLEFLPGDAPTAQPSVSGAPSEPRPAPKQEAPAPSASGAPHAAPATSLPDGGWVKPAWAIPDGEPVRRPPVSE